MKAALALAATILIPAAGLPRTAGEFFVSEPDSVFTQIDRSLRMDMVDYYNSGKKVEVKTRMGGSAQIERLTSDFLQLRIGESATVEMKQYATGKSDTLLVVIKTLKTPADDSQLMTFDQSWQPENTDKIIKLPEVNDFLTESGKKKKGLLEAVEFPLIALSFTESGEIEARLSLSEYMSTEAYAGLKPYLKDKLVFGWTGKRFKLRK